MRIRYSLAALLILTSIAVIVTNSLEVLYLPDSLTFKLYLYGLGALGLFVGGRLAHEARTGHRLNGKIDGGCVLILSGAAGVVIFLEAYWTDTFDGWVRWYDDTDKSDMLALCGFCAVSLIIGIRMLVSAFRSLKQR